MPIDDDDDQNLPQEAVQPVVPAFEPEVITTRFLNAIDALPVADQIGDAEALAIQEAERQRLHARLDLAHPYNMEDELADPVVDRRIPVIDLGYIDQPTWLPLSISPMYSSEQRRAFVRNLFSQYTQTPFEDIFGTPMPVRQITDWLHEAGEAGNPHTVDFGALEPGLSSNCQKFAMAEYTYLLVTSYFFETEFAGTMLYGWRETPAPRPALPAPGRG